MRVLLVYPNIEQNSALPQVGISSLLACLKEAGHETELLDFTYLDLGDAAAELRRCLAAFEPELTGLSIRSFEWDFVRERLLPVLAKADIPVVAGGPHPTAAPEEVISEPGVSFLVRGEGEETLVALTAALGSGAAPETVEGLWVKDGGSVKSSEVRPLVGDLDSLPFPDWSHWNERHFSDSHSRVFFKGLNRIGALESSRGCPYSCPYCITPMLHGLYEGKGKYHREKSVGRIIAEALDRKEKFRLDYVNFIDETFLLKSRRVEEFCDLWSREVDLPFRFTTRPETVTEERIRMVKAAGANLIGLGIESGDPEYRREHLNRGYSQQQVRDAVDIISRNGIKSFGFFVMGMPHETRQSIEQTLDMLWNLKLDHYMVSLCFPFKGTPFYDIAVREGMLEKGVPTAANVWEDTPLSLPGLKRSRLVRLRNLVSYFGRKNPRWRPLMRLCEKSAAAYFVFKVFRKIERRLSPSDIL